MRKGRYVSVWLPDWPAQRLSRQPGRTPPEPFIVVVMKGQKQLVHAVSREASRAGLRAGMTVAFAQAKVAGLHVVEADPEADRRALRRAALWALRFSPLVALEEPDGFVLDTGGAAHLFGGEAALLEKLSRRLEENGLSPQLSLTSSRLLSRALARFAPETNMRPVEPGREAEAAAPLPVTALGADRDVTTRLRRLGFDRVEQLFAAPRSGLALRFGTDLIRKLDLLTGREPDTLTPLSMPEMVRAEMAFAEPIAHTAGLEGALHNLTARLCAELEKESKGARIVDLHAMRVNGEAGVLRIRTSAPSQCPEHLRRLFLGTLDRIDPGFGIERVTLTAPSTEKTEARQTASHDERQAELAPMVDRIAARIGDGHVFRLQPTERDLPERAFRPEPALAGTPAVSWDLKPRPVQLIVPPERTEVLALLPDHPPARFAWRGRQRRIKRADGPECIFGEWWQCDEEVALTRDYYRVEDEEGGRWWLFRARDTASGEVSWFVHGIFG